MMRGSFLFLLHANYDSDNGAYGNDRACDYACDSAFRKALLPFTFAALVLAAVVRGRF